MSALSTLSCNHLRRLSHNKQPVFSFSLLALVIASSLHAQAANAETSTDTNQTLLVTAAQNNSNEATNTDYSVPVTRASTKMALTVRDTPQSVSVITK